MGGAEPRPPAVRRLAFLDVTGFDGPLQRSLLAAALGQTILDFACPLDPLSDLI